MPDREKLIELMGEAIDYSVGSCIEHRDCESCPGRKYGNKCRDYLEADHLIANGVTVGKPLTEYLHPVDNYAVLKGKYLVFKADTGERVSNCFVLRPDKDAAAVEALRAYACSTDNKTLSDDIYSWVGKGVTVQKWIPVSERLPDAGKVLCLTTKGHYKVMEWLETFKCWTDPGGIDFTNFKRGYVTHWMLLPEPPKENEK